MAKLRFADLSARINEGERAERKATELMSDLPVEALARPAEEIRDDLLA